MQLALDHVRRWRRATTATAPPRRAPQKPDPARRRASRAAHHPRRAAVRGAAGGGRAAHHGAARSEHASAVPLADTLTPASFVHPPGLARADAGRGARGLRIQARQAPHHRLRRRCRRIVGACAALGHAARRSMRPSQRRATGSCASSPRPSSATRASSHRASTGRTARAFLPRRAGGGALDPKHGFEGVGGALDAGDGTRSASCDWRVAQNAEPAQIRDAAQAG